jgi:hypothetical protein
MKRSLVLQNIADMIKAYEDNIGTEHCAEHILSYLEHIKMEPPAIRVPCPTHYIDATGQVKQGEDSVLFVNEWSPEDG